MEDKDLKTGISELDKIGIKQGDLVVLAGRPATGKTSLMLTMLSNFLQSGKKCEYASIATSKEQLIEKLLCQNAGINSSKLLKDAQNEDWVNLASQMDNFCNYNFYLDDDKELTIKDLEEHINKISPEVIFIDYLQLINSDNNIDRKSALSQIVTNLKEIAKKYNLIIIFASQLSAVTSKQAGTKPTLSDIKDAVNINEDADKILLLHREEDAEDAELIIAKNNNGPTPVINLSFEPDTTRFVSAKD